MFCCPSSGEHILDIPHPEAAYGPLSTRAHIHRKLKKEELMLLKAREVIAINQDPLGVAGDRVWKQGPYEVPSQQRLFAREDLQISRPCHIKQLLCNLSSTMS
jgi:hypothetical protein